MQKGRGGRGERGLGERGLGETTLIDKVEIRWPSGRVQELQDLEINQLHEIHEPDEERAAPLRGD